MNAGPQERPATRILRWASKSLVTSFFWLGRTNRNLERANSAGGAGSPFSYTSANMDTKKIERVSKALADETRLRIFEAISAKSDLTCGELVTLHGVTPATISHHLKILTDAELIECRKEGQFVYSRTVPETIVEYSAALSKMAGKVHARQGRTR
jgi:ArsR family transcriptional regulator, arsenate/arsenite/antimonite-responsive transcriptional repressor